MQNPSSHLHCAFRLATPRTCRRARLLGPCFKTGRKKPMSQLAMLVWIPNSQRRIRKCALRAEGHPQTGVASDAQAKKHSRQLFTLKHTACADVPKAHSSLQQSQQDVWFSSLPFQRFQATFNSLSKVLFIFPSWYLFTIGLEPVFSFRWNLPPYLRSNSEERDSENKCCGQRTSSKTQDSHPGTRSIPRGLRSSRR